MSRINKLDRNFFYGQILSHCFHPISSQARAKMAATMNKVYTQDELETMVMHLFNLFKGEGGGMGWATNVCYGHCKSGE